MFLCRCPASTSSARCFLVPGGAGASGRDAGASLLSATSCPRAAGRLSPATLAEPLNAELFPPHFVFITRLQKHFCRLPADGLSSGGGHISAGEAGGGSFARLPTPYSLGVLTVF